jgi:hypothetical protein
MSPVPWSATLQMKYGYPVSHRQYVRKFEKAHVRRLILFEILPDMNRHLRFPRL